MTLRVSFCALPLLLAVDCHDRQTKAMTANQAIEVGNAYLAERHPPTDVKGWVIEPIDMGDRWRLSYDLPGAAGGHRILVVNKPSGKVVHMEAAQ